MSDLETSAAATPSTADNTTVTIEPTASVTETIAEPVQASWTDSLPDDLKSNASLSKFKDPNEVAKAYVNLEKSMGNKIKIPGENATPEEVSAFYTKLGRPETSEGYALQETLIEKADLLNIVPQYKDQVDEFSKIAYDLGLSKSAAEKLVNWQTEKLESQMETLRAQTDSARDQLNKIWGHEAETKFAEANKAAQLLASKYPDEMKSFQNSDGARNPITMIMLSELSKLYKEDKSSISGNETISTTTLEQRLNELKQPGSALSDRYHPDHLKAIKEYNEITNQLY